MALRDIMVVDDSDADLLYAEVILKLADPNQSVLSIGTGQDALEHLRRPGGHAVDVILLDLNMPEMDGFEFLEHYGTLHEHQQASAVVVLLSSSPDPSDRARALAYPCVRDYFVKPLRVETAARLATLVNEHSKAA